MSVITTGQLAASIEIYRKQQATLRDSLAQLEQQKATGLKTLDLLEGACQACEALIQTVKNQDELEAAAIAEAEKANLVAEAALPLPAGVAAGVHNLDGVGDGENPPRPGEPVTA